MIDEPLIWRLFDLSSALATAASAAQTSTTATAAADPIVHIGTMSLDGLPAVITFKSDESVRPRSFRRGLTGAGVGISMAFANLEQVRLRVLGIARTDQHALYSSVVASLTREITRQVLSQWTKVLFAASWGKGATRVLDQFATAVSGLSMDKEFRPQGSQQSQVTDLVSGVAAGGESLAKGVWRGVTGLVTKPVEVRRQGGKRQSAWDTWRKEHSMKH